MRNSRVLLSLASGCIGLWCSGCSLEQPYPAKDSFVLRGGDIGRAPVTLNETVQVQPVRIAPPYDGRSLVYRTGDVSFTRDYYNVFIAPPDELATAELIRLLSESGLFARVSSVASGGNSDVILECMVTDLYADERDPKNPAAICRAKFRRLSNAPGNTLLIDSGAMEATVPVASNTGEGIATALGKAFGTTVKKFVDAAAKPSDKVGANPE